jgi:hypothetical protein
MRIKYQKKAETINIIRNILEDKYIILAVLPKQTNIGRMVQ